MAPWSPLTPNATCPKEINKLSQFPVFIDGLFTNGADAAGHLQGEWSDIIPQVFVIDATGLLFRTCEGDPNASSYVYTALAPGEGVSVDALYLMYDFLAAKNDPSLFAVGQTLAQVSFGVHLPTSLGGVEGQNTPITVRFVVGNGGGIGTSAAAKSAAVIGGGGSSVDVVFDVNIPGGQTNVPGFQIGLVGAVSFGPSVNSATPHLQAELEVGLRIPAGFGAPGGPFPGNGIDPATGLYDPAPKFWGSSFNNAPGGGGGTSASLAATLALPIPPNLPASANIVTINPDGSVTVNSGADAGAGFVPFHATDLRAIVLANVKTLRASATDRRVQHELDEVIQLLTASLNPAFHSDSARLKPGRGRIVFFLDARVVEELGEVIPRGPATPFGTGVQGAIDDVLGLDAEYARVAIADAIAAGVNTRKIKAAQDELARGDTDAAANRNVRAIIHYASAWSFVTGFNGRF